MTPIILATCGGDIAITSDNVRYLAVGLSGATALACILLSIHRARFDWAPFYGTLLLLHPAWFMTVDAGDCGIAMRFLSITASLALVMILLCQIFWPDSSKTGLLFGCSVATWAIFFVAIALDELNVGGPSGSFFMQALFSLRLGGMSFNWIAFILTLLVVLFLLLNRKGLSPRNKEASTLPDPKKQRSQNVNVAFRLLWLFLALVLLAWSCLYAVGMIAAHWLPYTIAKGLALGWAAILLIAAGRGRFPGWH